MKTTIIKANKKFEPNGGESIIQGPVMRNLLKYAAGHAITCPSCGQIMDWRKTTVAELKQDGKGLRTWTTCTKCYEAKVRTAVLGGVEKVRAAGKPIDNLELEVIQA